MGRDSIRSRAPAFIRPTHAVAVESEAFAIDAEVESFDDVGAIIVGSDNRVFVSKRLEGKIEIQRPPADGIESSPRRWRRLSKNSDLVSFNFERLDRSPK